MFDRHRVEALLKKKCVNPLPVPTLEERVKAHFEDGTDTLHICPNAWALRHRFVNKLSGEVIHARCGSWRCLYCGPRKVDQWRQVIAEAKPTLHVVLTMVGNTVAQAARTLTTWVQAMRRGSKGKGRNRIGARPAYEIEYFAVLERHKDFERVGFHWHILIVGVDFLPHEHIEACLLSATKKSTRQGTKVADCWVERVGKGHAIGYVTKYLTKDITREEKGVRVEEHEMIELGLDENGNPVERRRVMVTEEVSHARRIRYSKGFFPESVKAIRVKLFSRAGSDGDAEEEGQEQGEVKPLPETEITEQEQASLWALVEVVPFTDDIREYRRRREQVLREAVEEYVANGRCLSRRVLSIWSYQGEQLRQERWRKKEKVAV